MSVPVENNRGRVRVMGRRASSSESPAVIIPRKE